MRILLLIVVLAAPLYGNVEVAAMRKEGTGEKCILRRLSDGLLSSWIGRGDVFAGYMIEKVEKASHSVKIGSLGEAERKSLGVSHTEGGSYGDGASVVVKLEVAPKRCLLNGRELSLAELYHHMAIWAMSGTVDTVIIKAWKSTGEDFEAKAWKMAIVEVIADAGFDRVAMGWVY